LIPRSPSSPRAAGHRDQHPARTALASRVRRLQRETSRQADYKVRGVLDAPPALLLGAAADRPAGNGAIDGTSRLRSSRLATFMGEPLTRREGEESFKGEPAHIGVSARSPPRRRRTEREADCVEVWRQPSATSLGRSALIDEGVINASDGSAPGATVKRGREADGDAASDARALMQMLTSAEAKNHPVVFRGPPTSPRWPPLPSPDGDGRRPARATCRKR